jgi:hypothetical protein
MAKMVLLASFVSINAVDLSAYANSIEATMEVDAQDATTFASGGWKEILGGLKSAGLSLGFKQDVAAAALDATIWPLFGTVVPFEVRLANAVASASNPKYTGSVLIQKWTPIGGNVGDIAESSVEWPSSGVVTRAVS